VAWYTCFHKLLSQYGVLALSTLVVLWADWAAIFVTAQVASMATKENRVKNFIS
jgi:hypothetical protein